MKVNGKTLLVTGAGGGVGRELVLLLLSKGASVAAVDISEARLKETAKIANSKKLTTHICDLSKKTEVEKLFDEVIAAHKEVDGVINNAGVIQPFVKIQALDYDKIEAVMKINFYGPLYVTKTFLPHLLERPVAHVLNVSSMGGFFPVPGQAIYGASKAALKLMTEALAAEMIGTNVHVTVVFPGAIETDIAKNSKIDMKGMDAADAPKMKMLKASEAAQIIVKGMEKNKFQVYAGKDSKLMKFIYKINPKMAPRMMYKALKDQLES